VDLKKDLLEELDSDFKAIRTINEEIQTEERNHARLNVFEEIDKHDRMLSDLL